MARVDEIVGLILSLALAAGAVVSIAILGLHGLAVVGRIAEAILAAVGVY